MNIYVSTAMRETFAALDTLLNQKERAELELKDTISQLETQIRVINEAMAATPTWAW